MLRLIVIYLIGLLIPYLCYGYGNHQTLEITNIKASGTGTPAISEYNRIYRAYPGITYEIPVAAIGGKYPYVYSLSGQPAGMTIDSKSGIITWLDPQSSDASITVRVTDADSDYVEATWGITVGTSGFLFVDDTTDASGTGTIDDPYDSLQDILDLGVSAVNSIVYFRAGSYAIPPHNGVRDATYGCNLVGRSHVFIGYPDESVTFNFYGVSNSYAQFFEEYEAGSLDGIWMQDILFQSAYRWVLIETGSNYVTFWKNTVDGLTFNDIAGNPGSFCSYSGTSTFNYVADNIFTNAATAQHIGSLYATNRMLIERNDFGSRSGLGPDLAIKQDNDYITVRGNYFHSGHEAIGHPNNGVFYNCDHSEILFNYFSNIFGPFNNDGATAGPQLTTWYERNTISAQGPTMKYLDSPDSCEGPWFFGENVYQNAASGVDYHYSSAADAADCITFYDELGATSGLIDTSGKLLEATYVGLRGWQLADGTTPMEASADITCYQDADSDLYGHGVSEQVTTCSSGYYEAAHFTALTGDCDDTNANINPGETETCDNTTDEDCSGVADTCPGVRMQIQAGSMSIQAGTTQITIE